MDNMKIPDKTAMEQAMRFAQSEAGQRLLASLQQSEDKTLQDLLQSSTSANEVEIRSQVQKLINSSGFRKLVKQLGDRNG